MAVVFDIDSDRVCGIREGLNRDDLGWADRGRKHGNRLDWVERRRKHGDSARGHHGDSGCRQQSLGGGYHHTRDDGGERVAGMHPCREIARLGLGDDSK